MDDLLLSRVRLAIIAELVTADWVSFTELLKAVSTTNGNLSIHLGKLVEAGYVEEVRRFVGRRPQSRYRLTGTGRKALLDHVATLQELAAYDGRR